MDIAQRVRVQLFSYLFMVEGERPFINKKWSDVQENHGEIIGQLSIERDLEDIGDKRERHHMKIVP